MSDSSHEHAPGLPTVHDEAGDSPQWLPIVGLVLLALVAAAVLLREAAREGEAEAPAADAAPAVEAPVAPAAAPAAH